jgi:hypothetical protein
MGTGGGARGYGRRFKEEVRRFYSSHIYFGGRGEMIPNKHSYCELDPVVKDRWGLPVLRFHWRWSEHELKQVIHLRRTAAELIAAWVARRTTRRSAIPVM